MNSAGVNFTDIRLDTLYPFNWLPEEASKNSDKYEETDNTLDELFGKTRTIAATEEN